jgi:hypothetical protein
MVWKQRQEFSYILLWDDKNMWLHVSIVHQRHLMQCSEELFYFNASHKNCKRQLAFRKIIYARGCWPLNFAAVILPMFLLCTYVCHLLSYLAFN